MYDNFEILVEDFKKGKIQANSLSRRLSELLRHAPDLNITHLLERLLQLFAAGDLDADDYRALSLALTEQNIQITHIRKSSDSSEITHNSALHYRDTHVNEAHAPLDLDAKTLLLAQEKTQLLADKTLLMPGTKENKDDRPLTLGNVLKNRFVLTEVIGKGGMGYVYKARDLVKVEARDKDPYVAIKILSERFKKHSAAFIALQREASKSQRLAHPNIATVYDFDYDDNTVFMTMELMRGQPLDRFIKKIPSGGLPLPQAMHYIEQICSGLAYAHKQKLIHSDLKPANIFLNDSGVVKLLDFGITRAIKTESEAEEKTLFDPASLKALTPAYASIEMFNGDNPDPRDDIYALACVAYEMLSGLHPYKKVAANKALELGLKPPPIKKISRRQQRALNRALKLNRHGRTPSVEQFLAGFIPAKSHIKSLSLAAAILLGLGGALLAPFIQKQLKEEAQLQMIQSIKAGNKAKLVSLLENIEQEDENTRLNLTTLLRKEIIDYYQTRINDAINAKEKHYDFPLAFSLLEQVKRLYPDSASLGEAERQLRANKQRLIDALTQSYHRAQQHGGDTQRILTILREADPQHALLNALENQAH